MAGRASIRAQGVDLDDGGVQALADRVARPTRAANPIDFGYRHLVEVAGRPIQAAVDARGERFEREGVEVGSRARGACPAATRGGTAPARGNSFMQDTLRSRQMADAVSQGAPTPDSGEIVDQTGGGGVATKRAGGGAAEGTGAAPRTGTRVPQDSDAAGPETSAESAGSETAESTTDSVSVLAVRFGRVRFARTSAGVDRIPPNVPVQVAVTVTGWHPPMSPIAIDVVGSGGAAGTVTVNGSPSAELTRSGTLTLLGTVQTTPGSAGGLSLRARIGSTTVGTGSAFSIAAYPENIQIALSSPVTGPSRGIAVSTTFDSDSGARADLDQVQWSELVQEVSATGVFTGLGRQNSGYLPTAGNFVDTHSTPVSVLTGPGTREANQTFKFKDDRTGVTDVPMHASGFKINRDVHAAAAGFEITTEKHGEAVTANGIASSAGIGSAAATQAV